MCPLCLSSVPPTHSLTIRIKLILPIQCPNSPSSVNPHNALNPFNPVSIDPNQYPWFSVGVPHLGFQCLSSWIAVSILVLCLSSSFSFLSTFLVTLIPILCPLSLFSIHRPLLMSLIGIECSSFLSSLSSVAHPHPVLLIPIRFRSSPIQFPSSPIHCPYQFK